MYVYQQRKLHFPTLEVVKKNMNLKDQHGNSVATVIVLYVFCGRQSYLQVVSWFTAYWSFTSEPTLQEDDKNQLNITVVATQTMADHNSLLWLSYLGKF